jgi:hypothetical protein
MAEFRRFRVAGVFPGADRQVSGWWDPLLRGTRAASLVTQMGPTRRSTPLSPARGSPKRNLAPSVVAVEHPVLRPASLRRCHRCSHRHPVPSHGRFRSEDRAGPSAGSETGPSVGGPAPITSCEVWVRVRAEALSRLHGERPGENRPMAALLSRSSLGGLTCAGPKSFACQATKAARTVSAITN